MDYCIKITVVLAICSQIVTGRAYVPFEKHSDFHHSYEHPQRTEWHHGLPGWHQHRPSAGYQRPGYYQRDQKENPQDKEFWRAHHSADLDSGSWEYPDFPGHGNPNSWGHQSWNNNKKPNHWQHYPVTSRPVNPNWTNGNPGTWPPVTPPPTSPRRTTESESQDTLSILLCIRSCPVTSEYNPVCGSNNVTYGNPGRLECAKYCGVDVSVQRNAACPAPGQNFGSNPTNIRPSQPTNPTLKPIIPTRFTTVEVPPTRPEVTSKPNPAESNPPFTISPDILNSIFSSSTTTEDDNFDIDIRTRSREPEPLIYPV